MNRFDLAIIGGGLAGVTTALFAARRGAQVVVLERGVVNGAASGANAGSIHAQIPFEPFRQMGRDWATRYAETIPLFMASIARWKALDDELGGALGVETKGGLMVAGSDADLRALEAKAAIEHRAGLPVDLLDASGLAEKAPFVASGMAGAACCASEGKADPLRATPALASAAEKVGAKFRTGFSVERIECHDSGFTLSGSAGEVSAHRIVNAAGAGAAQVAALVGLHLPLEGHAIQVSVTEKHAPLIPFLVYFTGEKLTLKQTREGGFLIGGGWPALPGKKPTVSPVNLARNLTIARQVVPALSSVKLLRSWTGTVNGTADWRPLLGEAPGVPGFYLNCFPWMGFTAAPAVSEAMAALALNEKPELDISRFLLAH